MNATRRAWPRREMLRTMSLIAGVTPLFARTLVALAEEKPAVTTQMIEQAEWVTGLKLTDDQRKLMLGGANKTLAGFAKLRAIPLDNGVIPALIFDPAAMRPRWALQKNAALAAKQRATAANKPAAPTGPAPAVPETDEDIAFASIRQLGLLLRNRKMSAVELTQFYLKRLRQFDPVLKCVVNFTEELGLKEAGRADRDFATADNHGPLQGIPWGAKDLLSVPGYPTTWGAKPYEKQMRPETASVAWRLNEAGAALVAKLSLGALAMGDVWFGGKTRNPWNPKQGSSGSSAGPASATAAGLVGFSIGSETLGSIVSPCTRCGCTGLRPTFGRVSRYGAMALSWTMDKLGPITRCAEDCALVFQHILGPDGKDPSVLDQPFEWPFPTDPRLLRVGYVKALFEEDRSLHGKTDAEKARLREAQTFDLKTLDQLRHQGFALTPIKLPDQYPLDPLETILNAEAATAFDELTRSGQDRLLTEQGPEAWPTIFRDAQLIPAVEYIRSNRFRLLVITEMEQLMANFDVYLAPSFGGKNLLLTNLTGHPAVVAPNGFHTDGTPASITFIGGLFKEAHALAVAHAYQKETDFHLKRPPLKPAAG